MESGVFGNSAAEENGKSRLPGSGRKDIQTVGQEVVPGDSGFSDGILRQAVRFGIRADDSPAAPRVFCALFRYI